MGTRTFLVGILVLVLAFGAGAAFSTDTTVTIKVSPHVIAMNSKATWTTVHADIPYRSVDTASGVTLNGLAAATTFADDRGDLVAKFRMADVKNIVSPPSATLTLYGQTLNGDTFEGSETVSVVTNE